MHGNFPITHRPVLNRLATSILSGPIGTSPLVSSARAHENVSDRAEAQEMAADLSDQVVKLSFNVIADQ